MTGLDVKAAVTVAKQYMTELFANEGIADMGLEEVEHDDARGVWLITLGFSRPWSKQDLDPFAAGRRDYKVLTITDGAEVVSLKNREPANAG